MCLCKSAGRRRRNAGLLATTEYNLRARYDWQINDYKMFFMVGAQHVGDMQNEPSSFQSGRESPCRRRPGCDTTSRHTPRMTRPSTWQGTSDVQAYGTNLGNSDASLFTSSGQSSSRRCLSGADLGIKSGSSSDVS